MAVNGAVGDAGRHSMQANNQLIACGDGQAVAGGGRVDLAQ